MPAASPFRSLQDLITAFKARPESISWGGGSAGGSDQISRASSPKPSASSRGASTTSRSPAAASRCRRSSAARCRSASTASPSCPADRGRYAACAGHLERRAAAGRRHSDAARAGRERRVRELALAGRSTWHHPCRSRAPRVRRARWSDRRHGASRWPATVGSIGISMASARALRRCGRGPRPHDPEEARDRRDHDELNRSIGRVSTAGTRRSRAFGVSPHSFGPGDPRLHPPSPRPLVMRR